MHTLEDVQAALKAAVERHPNRRNPYSVSEGACLNTSKNGIHCIAAQVVVDLGHPMTAYDDTENSSSIEGTLQELGLHSLFAGEAISYLIDAQCVFDEAESSQSRARRQWKSAYNLLLQLQDQKEVPF